jgi:hypothetical protein
MTSAVSPLMCAMLIPGEATRACATGQESFVSLMRDGLVACVVIHDAPTRGRRRDATPTAAWQAATAVTRGAGRRGWRPRGVAAEGLILFREEAEHGRCRISP